MIRTKLLTLAARHNHESASTTYYVDGEAMREDMAKRKLERHGVFGRQAYKILHAVPRMEEPRWGGGW